MHTWPTVTIAFVLATLPVLADEDPDCSDVRSRIQLLPRRSGDANPPLSERNEDPVAARANGLVAEWKTFQDDHVIFRYPDDPGIRLEVKLPRDRITIGGNPVRSTEIDFVRAYRLANGKRTYGLLLLAETSEFDDSICFCGAVVYQKYLFRNGALYRFDFLKNGLVKKAQIVGDDLRVVLFEWTHMRMTQEDYIKLALSVNLSTIPCDQVAMRKTIFDKYGFDGRLGFLEKGMSRDEVLALLGTPQTKTASSLTYVHTEDRWQTTIVIDFHGGTFTGFSKDFRKCIELTVAP
jgi:hypothetical protein